jgi:hypothetical protein
MNSFERDARIRDTLVYTDPGTRAARSRYGGEALRVISTEDMHIPDTVTRTDIEKILTTEETAWLNHLTHEAQQESRGEK